MVRMLLACVALDLAQLLASGAASGDGALYLLRQCLLVRLEKSVALRWRASCRCWALRWHNGKPMRNVVKGVCLWHGWCAWRALVCAALSTCGWCRRRRRRRRRARLLALSTATTTGASPCRGLACCAAGGLAAKLWPTGLWVCNWCRWLWDRMACGRALWSQNARVRLRRSARADQLALGW